MRLPKSLITEFVRITNDRTKENAETTVYGNIVKNGEQTYVKLDGSDILTPVLSTADANDGERVTVLIKNHTATVTGNITSPSARTGDVQALDEAKLDAEEATMTYATIENLDSTDVKVNDLEADYGEFKALTATNFESVNASIDNLEATLSATEGTSGIWSYRKWSNGRAELFGSYTVSGVSCSNQFGSAMYRSAALTIESFPFSIYEPNLTASYESDGYGAFLWATSTTTETSPPSYYLVRPESGTIDSGKINFHVIGKWTE